MRLNILGNFRLQAGLAVVLLGMLFADLVQAGNYVLRVDGQEIELDLNMPVDVAIDRGKSVSVLLRQKSEQVWHSDGISFAYSTTMSPARSQIDKDISQVSLITPSGDSLAVQHYIGLNPANIVSLMVAQLTDEEVRAGFKRTTKPITRKLTDGTTLTGTQVCTEKSGESRNREILAVGNSRGGYLIVNKTSGDPPQDESQMIELFWHTLQLGVKPQ